MAIEDTIRPAIYGLMVAALGLWSLSLIRIRAPFRPAQIGLLIAGVIAVGYAWYLLFSLMAFQTEVMLVPWDQWASLAPNPSTWQRQVNEFFNRAPNMYLPGLATLGISGGLLLYGMLRAGNSGVRSWLPLAFALTIAAYVVMSFLFTYLLMLLQDLWLPQPRPSIDLGYHRTWPGLLGSVALIGLLLWSQWKICSAAGRARSGGGSGREVQE